jgi:DnaJ-class molecular chaperone
MSSSACKCSRCTDGGSIATEKDCPECAGQPFVNIDGHTMVCGYCHGTGKENVPCPDCGGHTHQA